MIKNVAHRVWAFDLEWVPDPLAGRLVYGFSDDVTDPAEIMRMMWEKGGATEEDPTPFLKTALCRVVSVAALERRQFPDGTVKLNLCLSPTIRRMPKRPPRRTWSAPSSTPSARAGRSSWASTRSTPTSRSSSSAG